MSRTLKDRPYSVLKADPKMARYASHHHITSRREKVGEEVITRDGYDRSGELIHDIPFWTRPLYKHWVENVDCTLEDPESPDKHCYWWLEYYPNVRSNKDFKSLTNGALRSKVRQQLHTALLDGDWEAVDIHADCKYAWYGWWD